MTQKDLAPESEEQKFRQKCKELKRRIQEVEESNELATLAITRTKTSIRRLRLEYSILLERLEANAVNFEIDEISPPPSPNLEMETEKLKTPTKKMKKLNNGSTKKVKDPNLPKRPTNAYLIFCDLEKERIKKETGDNSLTSITELGKTLVENWKNLDEDARKPYHKLYEDAKQKFKKEMIEYSKTHKIEGLVDVDEDVEQDAEGEQEDAEADIDDDDNDDNEDNDNDEPNLDSMDIEPFPKSEPDEFPLDSKINDSPNSHPSESPSQVTPVPSQIPASYQFQESEDSQAPKEHSVPDQIIKEEANETSQ